MYFQGTYPTQSQTESTPEHMYFQGTYPIQSQTDSTLTGTYVLSRHISDSITNREYT